MRKLKGAKTREFRGSSAWDVFDDVAEWLATHDDHVVLAVNYVWEDDPTTTDRHVVYLTTETAAI